MSYRTPYGISRICASAARTACTIGGAAVSILLCKRCLATARIWSMTATAACPWQVTGTVMGGGLALPSTAAPRPRSAASDSGYWWSAPDTVASCGFPPPGRVEADPPDLSPLWGHGAGGSSIASSKACHSALSAVSAASALAARQACSRALSRCASSCSKSRAMVAERSRLGTRARKRDASCSGKEIVIRMYEV